MLNDRELATVLAALRYWQKRIAIPPQLRDHFNEHAPLDDNDIDDLCERLNCGESISRQSFSLAEIRNGTGFPKGVRFQIATTAKPKKRHRATDPDIAYTNALYELSRVARGKKARRHA